MELVIDLKFRVLGPLEVYRGDRLIPVPAVRERTVLAALLLNTNKFVRTERLIETLWGDRPPARARNTLHSLVYRLRRRLEPAAATPVLETTQFGYRLCVVPGQLDVDHFEELSAKARQARAAGRPDAAANLFRAALSLWRGRLLACLDTISFEQSQQALQERYLEVVEARLEAELAAGKDAAIVAELRALVTKHPLREGLTGTLMTALYRARRQAEALAAYTDLRRILIRELGIEPDPELQRLHRAILAHDESLRCNS